jgi:tRNA(Arg) A34 adenosine deaminase TadA
MVHLFRLAAVVIVVAAVAIGFAIYLLSHSTLGVSEADIQHMRQAYAEAELALKTGDFPVGAVLVMDGKVLAKVCNEVVRNGDVRDHAEMLAIKRALHDLGVKTFREVRGDITLYTSYEPCAMCDGLIVQSRTPRVVVGRRKTVWRVGRSYLGHLVYRLRERGGLDEQVHDDLLKRWKANLPASP